MGFKNTLRTHYYEVSLSRNWGKTYDKTYIGLKGKFDLGIGETKIMHGTYLNTGGLFHFNSKNVKEITKQEFVENTTPENIFRPWDSSKQINERLCTEHNKIASKETSWEKNIYRDRVSADIGGPKEVKINTEEEYKQDFDHDDMNWMQDISSQEIPNEDYLKLGKVQLDLKKIAMDELWKKGLLLNEYYLIEDTDGFITVDNETGEYFVEKFQNKEIAIQYLRDTIEGSNVDKQLVDYLRLDEILTNKIKEEQNEPIQTTNEVHERSPIINDDQIRKNLLNKIVDTYPYDATVSESPDTITIFDEDPLIGKDFSSYDEALKSELYVLKNGEVLDKVFEQVELSEKECMYLKENYAISVDDYRELNKQKVVVNEANKKLLQLMESDSYYRDEKLILDQQKVVSQEQEKLKTLNRKVNNISNAPNKQPIQTALRRQAFSVVLNYSVADEVGHLKFVKELNDKISTIEDPSRILGSLLIKFDNYEILKTDDISLSNIKERLCTADVSKILDYTKEILRDKLVNEDDVSKYSQKYETVLALEEKLSESQLHSEEMLVSESISIT